MAEETISEQGAPAGALSDGADASAADARADARSDGAHAAAFLGETLGPLFLYEPADARVSALMAELASLDVAEAAAAWPCVDAAVAAEALERIQRGLRDESADDVLWEYRRLFVGPARKAAPPWGSVYTDRECVIFGESTLALRQWMRERGIARPGDGSEPEDHIGLMLLLMAWIDCHAPELLDEYLAEHLLTWAPHFLEEVEEATESGYLGGLAFLTRQSLAGMQRERGLSVELPRFYR